MFKMSMLGIGLALTGTVALAACAPSGDGDTTTLDAGTTVIDVRTPAEFAGGHLEGALNIDVQSPDATQQLAELDPNGSYVLYCRSGNRAGAALDFLKAQGFEDVVNAGGVQEAADETGLEIVD
ncbi:rhodanese-like domain-containing protein [Isoptericola sediminis]|nr:rhodanese-like domain-containing protein [Isoptericola sediminis]